MISSNFKIDSRTPEEVRARLGELAAAYTPEWVFDTENPDIGSVIGLLFSNQMSGSIDRLNQLPEKYRMEFVNMLNIGLLPAQPAQGVVVMELAQNTIPGVNVPAGTKLLGNGEDSSVVVFETLHDLHVTNSRLSSKLMISPEFGKIISLSDESFTLFDFNGEGIQENKLLLYHKSVFNTGENVALSIHILSPDGEDLSKRFANHEKYRWSYYDGEALIPFDEVLFEKSESDTQDAVILRRSGKAGKISLDNTEYSMVCLEAIGKVSESIDVKTLEIASSCAGIAPSFISNNENELDTDKVMLFGERASLYDECYIGHDNIFNQQGAFVTLSFNLSYKEKLATLTPEQENVELKVIKRKPRQVVFDTAHTCIQKVSFEYFNGTGWKRLIFTEDWETIFDGRVNGDVEMVFVCPDDWQPVTIGGNTERVIRMRVNQADNCYLQPCIHNMPLLGDVVVSYTYMKNRKLPNRLQTIIGTETRDVSQEAHSGKAFTAFAPLPYNKNALYLGFDRKMENAPVSLFFEVEQSASFSDISLKYEYSSAKGFTEMRVRDNTNNLSSSGTIIFIPGGDFAEAEVEGERKYWIRITDEDNAFSSPERFRPLIQRILPNAAEIHNTSTMEEESFYIETATADMSFQLAAENILSAEVFVNEIELSHAAKQELLKERGDDVRVEYNSIGRINEFFTRWREVQSFDSSEPESRHYIIDRLNNRILFGSGVNVRIPSAAEGVAFTVRARCCNGAAGNLPAKAVNSVMGNILYINEIYNPVATFGGSDIESAAQAAKRGANIINSKNRLVSELDFVREVTAFSNMVALAKCVISHDGRVNIAVLMRDYIDGSYSFDAIKDKLKARLLSKSEATLTESGLIISEPVFATITAEVWLAGGYAVSFETQSKIIRIIEDFIEPLKSKRKIGELPTARQFRVMLNVNRAVLKNVVIKHFTLNAKYTDAAGIHECELSALEKKCADMPFALGVTGINGEHKIHIL